MEKYNINNEFNIKKPKQILGLVVLSLKIKIIFRLNFYLALKRLSLILTSRLFTQRL